MARLDAIQTDPAPIADQLGRARDRGIDLVYLFAANEMPAELLHRFSGTLVDRRVTYSRVIHEGCLSGGVGDVLPLPSCDPPPELIALAIEAGGHSRFRVDDRFPEAAFHCLYTEWVRRSTRGEYADAIFVRRNEHDCIVGFITTSSAGDRGTIGLIAVDERFRGRGIAGSLLGAAHQWMSSRNLRTATVVTQAANTAACRLYERHGYRQTDLRYVYHFWVAAN